MGNALQPWIDRLVGADDLGILDVIGEIGESYRAAGRLPVPDLLEMLQHPHPNVRWGAAAALAAIGPDAEAAVPTLLRALDIDQDAQVRHDAAVALKQIAPGDPRVIEAFFRLRQDPDDDVRGAGEEGLHRALRVYDGPGAAAVRERIRQRLEDA